MTEIPWTVGRATPACWARAEEISGRLDRGRQTLEDQLGAGSAAQGVGVDVHFAGGGDPELAALLDEGELGVDRVDRLGQDQLPGGGDDGHGDLQGAHAQEVRALLTAEPDDGRQRALDLQLEGQAGEEADRSQLRGDGQEGRRVQGRRAGGQVAAAVAASRVSQGAAPGARPRAASG